VGTFEVQQATVDEKVFKVPGSPSRLRLCIRVLKLVAAQPDYKPDAAASSKSKVLRKSPGIKILIGIILVGISISRIFYGPTLADPNQEIGAKAGTLGLLVIGIQLLGSGLKQWTK
jgi:hypothetical protein